MVVVPFRHLAPVPTELHTSHEQIPDCYQEESVVVVVAAFGCTGTRAAELASLAVAVHTLEPTWPHRKILPTTLAESLAVANTLVEVLLHTLVPNVPHTIQQKTVVSTDGDTVVAAAAVVVVVVDKLVPTVQHILLPLAFGAAVVGELAPIVLHTNLPPKVVAFAGVHTLVCTKSAVAGASDSHTPAQLDPYRNQYLVLAQAWAFVAESTVVVAAFDTKESEQVARHAFVQNEQHILRELVSFAEEEHSYSLSLRVQIW